MLEKGDFFSEARRSWDRALEIDPAYAPALLGKGRYHVMMAYRGGDDPRAGMAVLEKVFLASPDAGTKAEAEFYMGIGHRRLGDEASARGQFGKCLKLDPAFMPAILASQA